MKTYFVELRKNGSLSLRFRLEAENRERAVYKAEQWFWGKYGGTLGSVSNVLVVSDLYDEVSYDEKFRCSQRRNRLLPESVIQRIVAISRGELVRNEFLGALPGPITSVRRVKRRRDFGKFPIPLIRQMKNGRLYYRVITQPQITRNGRRIRKRKYCDVPLHATSLSNAVREVKQRRLLQGHLKRTRYRSKVRSLGRTANLALKIERTLQSWGNSHNTAEKCRSTGATARDASGR